MKIFDERGILCPQPVIDVKKYLEAATENAEEEVWVDNRAAVDNLRNLAQQKAWNFSVLEEKDSVFRVLIEKTESDAVKQRNTGNNTVALVASSCLGQGDDTLGDILMKGMLYALSELDAPPKTLIFMNGGVHHTLKGKKSVEDLKQLEAKGTKVYVCGTCLQFYEVLEDCEVGEITNMYAIAEMLVGADHVIRL